MPLQSAAGWDRLRDGPSRCSRLSAQGLPPPPNQIAHPAASFEPQPPGGRREAGARVPPGSLAPPDAGLQQSVHRGCRGEARGSRAPPPGAWPGGPCARAPSRPAGGRAARSRLQPCARGRAAAARDVTQRAPRQPAAPRPAPRATASGCRGLRRPSDDALRRLRPGRG